MFAVTIAQSCPVSDTNPMAVYEPPPAAIVAASGDHGTTKMIVTLDANGQLTGISVLKSSGVPFLDQAAVNQTRRTKFAPEMQGCNPVGGRYYYSIDY